MDVLLALACSSCSGVLLGRMALSSALLTCILGKVGTVGTRIMLATKPRTQRVRFNLPPRLMQIA